MADAEKALDFAYRDVLAAFEAFREQAPADRPIILAAHSQGSLHLMRLLRDWIAGSSVEQRVAAAYVVGWPISNTADLGALGLPACDEAEDSGDRKSVVKGKSVAVSVVLGGRRFLKKKKQHK